LIAWLSPPPRAGKVNAETDCIRWLREQVTESAASGRNQDRSKAQWRKLASAKFGTDLTERAFLRAWGAIAFEYPHISKAGAKGKRLT